MIAGCGFPMAPPKWFGLPGAGSESVKFLVKNQVFLAQELKDNENLMLSRLRSSKILKFLCKTNSLELRSLRI